MYADHERQSAKKEPTRTQTSPMTATATAPAVVSAATAESWRDFE
jgi:hypothetical protein